MKIYYFAFSCVFVFYGCQASKQFDFTGLKPFPENFTFSTATASYQVEGAWNVSGKGENIWDRITHTNPDFIKERANGDIACDSYHKYKEDIQNAKKIGFKMYRFSLSWSRLFPTGNITKINEDGVRYYNDLIEELHKNGIEPMVTIFHWDTPQPLEDIGGWLNPIMVDYFAEYSRAVFKLFGDRVKFWVTINEATSITSGYSDDSFAPALSMHGVGDYIAGHNLIKAHAKAYRIYDREFRRSQKGKVSFVLNGAFFIPRDASNRSHVEAAERGLQFSFGWFGHPVYTKEGNYPAVMIEYVGKYSKAQGLSKSRLPTFTKEEIEEIRGTYDFLALNHYSSVMAEPGDNYRFSPSLEQDRYVVGSNVPGSNRSECDWMRVTPEGFRLLFNWLKKEYNDPEIFVSENGYCGLDTTDDIDRINYYSAYLKQMLLAINEDKCNIVGYTVWSLMDNFEWRDGYTKRFGIFRVDFNDPNRKRTMKLSAKFFRKLFKMISWTKNKGSEL